IFLSFVLCIHYHHNNKMNHLRQAYAKVFPLTSIRRFIVDQIFDWTIHLGYYGGIIIGIVLGILIPSYIAGAFIGYLVPGIYTQRNSASPGPITIYVLNIVFGLTILFFGLIIIVPICFLIQENYKTWHKDQLKYILELQEGKPDDEAVHIPVVTTQFQRFNYYVLPLATIQRYIARMLLFLTIGITIVISHMYVSLWMFPFTVDDKFMPWGLQWILSICIQAIIVIVVFLFYCCFEESCKRDWKKFKSQAESAINKK
ncbi:MAG: hypothetical protein MUO21_00925, partial [Nitrososphaeraceae archaeon]|nr:hypothetical protein [Nitrososphaeraceae archaeon]